MTPNIDNLNDFVEQYAKIDGCTVQEWRAKAILAAVSIRNGSYITINPGDTYTITHTFNVT